MAEAVCESSVSMGLHFPQEQLTRSIPIFARLLSPWLSSGAVIATLLSMQKYGQDNSQGQASEYFECTRKHYEHWDNIIDNHALKYFMITSSVINKTYFMHASRLFICNMNKK